MTPLSPTALEEAAKAIAASYGEDPDDYASLLDICGPNNEPLPTWQKYAEQATAAITACLAQMEKEGWVMVPAFPTMVMMEAAGKAVTAYVEKMAASGGVVETADYALRAVIHRAMLAAAQNGGEPCK